jgi:FKBP-type peptidyl-prolyl cis-trans isomerase FkpA
MTRVVFAVALVACASSAPPTVVIDPLPAPPPRETSAPEPPKKVPSAVTLASGLEIEDLTPGQGAEAVPGHEIVVHYVAYLTDGTEFDSSRKRATPFVFRLGASHVIKGWEEGVAGMRVGQLRRLTIPPSLAYGARGAPPTVPPDATLVFEIELLEVR